MNLLKPSTMTPSEKASLSSLLDRMSLYSVLGALAASLAGLVLFLIDSDLIVEAPWAFFAGTATVASMGIAIWAIRKEWKK